MRCKDCQGKNFEELNDEYYYCNDCGANIKKYNKKQLKKIYKED